MKTVKTTANQYYVATVTGEATVTDNASNLVLATASEAGQIGFVAIGPVSTISDDQAVVVRSVFNSASLGSAPERGTVDIAGLARKDFNNVFTGDNTHDGGETFNGPVALNGSLSLLGIDFARQFAQFLLDQYFMYALLAMTNARVKEGANMGAPELSVSLNELKFNAKCALSSNNYPSGVVNLLPHAGLFNSEWGIQVISILPQDGNACSFAGCDGPGAHHLLHKYTPLQLLENDFIISELSGQSAWLLVPTPEGIHVLSQGKHDVIDVQPDDKVCMLVKDSKARRIVMFLHGSNGGDWRKVGYLPYGYACGVGIMFHAEDTKAHNYATAAAVSGSAFISRFVPTGIFDSIN